MLQKVSKILKQLKKPVISLLGVIILLIGIITFVNLLDSFLNGDYQDIFEYLASQIILYEISFPFFGWFSVSIGFHCFRAIYHDKILENGMRMLSSCYYRI